MKEIKLSCLFKRVCRFFRKSVPNNDFIRIYHSDKDNDYDDVTNPSLTVKREKEE